MILIKYITVHGTTGEGPAMTVAERKLVTEAWVKAVKETKQHLMIQVGGAPLPDVLELVIYFHLFENHLYYFNIQFNLG